MKTIEFFVPGTPQPGGSKRSFPIRTGKFKPDPRTGRPVEIIRVNTVDDASKGKDWRSQVAFFAMKESPLEPMLGPMRLELLFIMPRPKGHFGSGKNAKALKPSAPYYCETKPDTLKLTRSTEDALTGIVWNDDRQVVEISARKIYGLRPGAIVRISPLDHTPTASALHPPITTTTSAEEAT